MPESNSITPKPRGGRNLILLWSFAVLAALITSGFSLYFYGRDDIYLDRSRPGYISKEEKASDEQVEKFPEDGEVNTKELDIYLKEYDSIFQKLDAYDEAFGPDPLSDRSLNIDYDPTEELNSDSSASEDAS